MGRGAQKRVGWAVWLAAAVLATLGGCGRGPFLNFAQLDLLPEQGDPLEDGCNKVDYLFVIDNSTSMADKQYALGQSVSDLIEGVEASLQTVDSVHVGVITTDAYTYNAPGCDELGGLVVHTGGYNSSEAQCGPFAEGHNYMTEEDDLREALACTTLVGTTGSNSEQPLFAARAAVDPEFSKPGACNEGFLRPDALLVVVFLTNEDSFPQTGAYEALVDAKGGHDESIVVITLAHTDYETCSVGGHAKVATNLIAWTEQFEHGLVESICASTFDEPFARATSVIAGACDG